MDFAGFFLDMNRDGVGVDDELVRRFAESKVRWLKFRIIFRHCPRAAFGELAVAGVTQANQFWGEDGDGEREGRKGEGGHSGC